MATNLTGLFAIILIYLFTLIQYSEYLWLIGVGLIMLILVFRNIEVEIESAKEKWFIIAIIVVTVFTIVLGM